MTLKAAMLGGAIPMPLRGVFGVYTGTLGAPARGYEPGVPVGNPPSVALSLLIKDSWTNPATASITALISTGITSTAQANANTVTSTRAGNSTVWDGAIGTTGLTDFPRNIVVTVTHGSAVVVCNGVITGIDRYGRVITETWDVSAGTTSRTYTSVTSFARVDSISITSASDCSTNTLKLGTGAVLGLSMPNPLPGVVKETSAGSIVTNGTFVAASVAANADKRGTYAPSSAPNGATSYVAWYICDDPSAL